MTASSSSNEPVVRFAQLCAALDNGFDGRADVLAAAGLDEAEWQNLCDEWLPQLMAPDLAQTFTQAYKQARADAAPEAAWAQSDIVLAEVDNEDTLVDEHGLVFVDPDVTVSTAFPLAGSALPFRQASFGQPDAVFAAPAHRPPPTPGAAADTTLEVPCAPLAAHAALPFPQPPANSPRRRQLRFDPHTGHPLATPLWIEDSDPSPSAR